MTETCAPRFESSSARDIPLGLLWTTKLSRIHIEIRTRYLAVFERGWSRAATKTQKFGAVQTSPFMREMRAPTFSRLPNRVGFTSPRLLPAARPNECRAEASAIQNASWMTKGTKNKGRQKPSWFIVSRIRYTPKSEFHTNRAYSAGTYTHPLP